MIAFLAAGVLLYFSYMAVKKERERDAKDELDLLTAKHEQRGRHLMADIAALKRKIELLEQTPRLTNSERLEWLRAKIGGGR